MKDEIVSKLELLSEYVENLRSYKKYSVEEIRNDFTIRGALERYLELSLECSIDIAEMIISYENLKRPDSYREVILTLGRAGIMPDDFAQKFSNAAGLRNVLVHMYAKIDIDEIYYNLTENLQDFNTFARLIAIYLEKKGVS
ncbi:Uncharacterised protein [uncultured archaeon]|nr:Uncharacterised protein [uncultured archaeon]